VWAIQAQLAQREGLYVEPAGAASVAGLWRAAKRGVIGPEEQVVCVLTGHGFKDETAARRMAEAIIHDCGDLVVSPEEIDEALLERLQVRL